MAVNDNSPNAFDNVKDSPAAVLSAKAANNCRIPIKRIMAKTEKMSVKMEMPITNTLSFVLTAFITYLTAKKMKTTRRIAATILPVSNAKAL